MARPNYGRRLMPSVLDELARTDPSRLYAAIPKTATVTDGFRDISVADIARCVNFMAKWIEERFGKSTSFETISFIGIADLRGAVIFQAAVKCGFKLLLPSPRNPPATNLSLMSQTKSLKLLYVSEVAPIVRPLLEGNVEIIHHIVPTFEEMLNSAPDHYPYEKTFEEAKNDPVVVAHSSGSTGMPKPITMTHCTFAVLDNEHNLPEISGRRKRDWSMWTFDGEARIYTVFPFFHLAGFLCYTVQTIFMNASPVLGPPNQVPDGELLRHVMQHQKLRSIFLPPAVIEQALHEMDGLDFFRNLDFLVYSGAPFNPEVGNRLSKVVELISPFGSTEAFPQPELAPDRDDWAYHEFNPSVWYEMQPYDENEATFEFVVFADESNKDRAAMYHNLPGTTKYHTKDLFVRHPHKPNLFRYYGRRDDIIVLANGEKFNPVPFEINLANHPALKGVLVVGNGKTQPALLVEAKDSLDHQGQKNLVEEISSLIDKSNRLVPGQGRIHHNKTIVASPDKPFTRTGKGTITRRLTEESYKAEVNELYHNPEKHMTASLRPILKPTYEFATVLGFTRGIVLESFPRGTTIGDDEELSAHGLDSVQTIQIIGGLKQGLREIGSKTIDWLSPRIVYHNSNIASLAKLLTPFLNDGIVPGSADSPDTAKEVDALVRKYAERLPKRSELCIAHRTKSSVALIGSTGYLGPYILAALLKDSDVHRVYCLNRGRDLKDKQEAVLSKLDKNLTSSFEKLEFLTVSLGEPRLGLSEEMYDKVFTKIDVTIYNSWKSDFGHTIQYFEPLVRATRDLIDIAAASKHNMRIVFVSSASSVMSMASKSIVPEAPVLDSRAAADMGYAQSKLAAEGILVAGAEQCGIDVTIARVGQIGGPSSGTGVWADQGWIFDIAKTSKTLKHVPDHVAPIDWVPVDTVAEMLHAFARQPGTLGLQVFNVVNPEPRPWDRMISILNKIFGFTLTEVPLREWVRQVREGADGDANDQDVARLPALKLLDYYETLGDGTGTSKFATDQAFSISQARMPALEDDLLEQWLRSWDL